MPALLMGTATPSPSRLTGTPSPPLSRSTSKSPPTSRPTSWSRRVSSPDGCASQDLESGFEIWQSELYKEVMRAAQFWISSMDGLEAELTELAAICSDIFQSDACCSDTDKVLELRALQALSRHSDSASKLRSFADLNHVALFKILKKYTKRSSDNAGLQTIFPHLLEESGLGNMARLDRLDDEIRRLSLLSGRCQGLSAEVSPGVLHMVAGVQSRPGFNTADGNSADMPKSFYFYVGTSLGLFIAIVILIWIPPEDSVEKPFSVPYFLAPFAVFRVGLSILLSLWGAGAVAYVCQSKGINYLYLLGVDPRCKIGPGFFFTRAAALTSIWILVFGTYVVDYKWMMLPQIGQDGFNKRSSAHYCAYPSILMILIFVGAILPSRTAPANYKFGLLRSVARTALAPFFVVSFADNVVGDVLTSLVKPLQDIPPTICYFLSAHPQTKHNITRFYRHADVCPDWVGFFVKPIIAALPLSFRALQCIRRFRDTGEAKHLWNAGKYCCALAVVIISAWVVEHASEILGIVCLLISSLYSAIWDLCLDWGLGSQDLLGVKLPARSLTRAEGRAEDPVGASSSTVTRPRASFQLKDRMFKPWTYRLCSLLDIFARMSWVFTLMPIDIVSNDIVQREVILVFLTALEIVRRSVWAALRIENEQHTNAGGFRAILWVPNILETQQLQNSHSMQTVGNPIVDDVASSIGSGSPLLDSPSDSVACDRS